VFKAILKNVIRLVRISIVQENFGIS